MSDNARRIARAVQAAADRQANSRPGRTKVGIVASVDPITIDVGRGVIIPAKAMLWGNAAMASSDQWDKGDSVALSLVDENVYIVHDVLDTGEVIGLGSGGGGGVSSHHDLTNLTDGDDHPQYALTNGTRGAFAAISHTHTIADVSGLGSALAAKSDVGHTHAFSTLTGSVSAGQYGTGSIVNADISASAAIAQSKIANLVTDLAAKAPSASPTLTGTVTMSGATAVTAPTVAITSNNTNVATTAAVTTALAGYSTTSHTHAFSAITGTISAGQYGAGTIVNADINASAAIAVTKLALGGSNTVLQSNGTTNSFAQITDVHVATANKDGVAGTASMRTLGTGSQQAAAGNHTHAFGSITGTISAGQYGAGSIVNADVSASAAIAYSKLALTGSLVNADINAAAAIAYSKLSLTGSIVNADINASAAIAVTKLALGSASTVLQSNGTTNSFAQITDAHVATANKDGVAGTASMRTLGTGSQQAAAGNHTHAFASITGTISAGQYGAGSITNADINAAAAISLSKLAVDPLARANHTGTQLASTISNFDTQVRTNRLDQMAAPLADIPMGTYKFTGMGAGSANGHSLRYEQLFTTGTLALLGPVSIDVSGNKVSINQFGMSAFASSAHTQPTAQLLNTGLYLGPGSSTATDWNITRTGASEASLGSGDVLKMDTPAQTVNDTTLATTAYVRSAVSGVGMAAPLGSLQAYTGGSLPVGWLYADGSAVSRTLYADLFALIGTTFGSGNGSTTFNLPDLRGRVPVGMDNSGGTDAGRLDVTNTLGGTGGAQYHTLTAAQIPSHGHDLPMFAGGAPTSTGDFPLRASSGLDASFRTGTNVVTSSGYGSAFTGNGAHNNMQPFQLVHWIIKAQWAESTPAWGNATGKVAKTSAQSCAHGSWIDLTFDTNLKTGAGVTTLTSSTVPLTCLTDGDYTVNAKVDFAATSSAGGRSIRLVHKNSAGTILAVYADGRPADSFSRGSIGVTEEIYMVAGDFIQVQVLQTSGAALNTAATDGTYHATVSMSRVGYQTNPVQQFGGKMYYSAAGTMPAETTVAALNGTWTEIYDTSPNQTMVDQANDRMVVPVSGYYRVKLSLYGPAISTYDITVQALVYLTSTAGSWIATGVNNVPSTSVTVLGAHIVADDTVYLTAGSVLIPAYTWEHASIAAGTGGYAIYGGGSPLTTMEVRYLGPT